MKCLCNMSPELLLYIKYGALVARISEDSSNIICTTTIFTVTRSNLKTALVTGANGGIGIECS